MIQIIIAVILIEAIHAVHIGLYDEATALMTICAIGVMGDLLLSRRCKR